MKLYDYPPRDEEDGVIVIHSGLSVTVCGHTVTLRRDNARHVAVVCVSVLDGYPVTGLEQPKVAAAANMLAVRAKRFLGPRWTVVRWEPPGKPFGYLSQGLGA